MNLSESTKKAWLAAVDQFQAAAGRNSDEHGFWDTTHKLRALEGIPPVLRQELENAITAQKICLMHGELSEMMEVYRKDPQAACTKVPTITAAEEEAADLLIRLLDMCSAVHLRLGLATLLKMEYNATRPYKHGRNF